VLREDANGLVNVVGLLEVELKNLSQLRKTIETAQSNRHIGSTSFNKASSRSHAILQFKITSTATTNSNLAVGSTTKVGANSITIKSKVNSGLTNNIHGKSRPLRLLFIDLAGSERGIDAQNNMNDNRKEGAEINQSLLAVCLYLFYSFYFSFCL
jgi:hypothetical protein